MYSKAGLFVYIYSFQYCACILRKGGQRINKLSNLKKINELDKEIEIASSKNW